MKSLSLAKLKNKLTYTLNYNFRFGTRSYDKVLSVSLDIRRTLEFDFPEKIQKQGILEKPIEGIRQNIFNYLLIQMRMPGTENVSL